MAVPLNPKHAATAAAGLESYIAQLERERAAIDQKIDESRDALRAMQRQCNGGIVSGANSARRKKGENLRQVREMFASQPNAAFTVTVLAQRLGVPQSSIQNVLRKNEEFTQGADGLWRWQGEAA